MLLCTRKAPSTETASLGEERRWPKIQLSSAEVGPPSATQTANPDKCLGLVLGAPCSSSAVVASSAGPASKDRFPSDMAASMSATAMLADASAIRRVVGASCGGATEGVPGLAAATAGGDDGAEEDDAPATTG